MSLRAAAWQPANQIFQRGEQPPAPVRDAVRTPVVRLAGGVAGSLPQLVVRCLMQAVRDAVRRPIPTYTDTHRGAASVLERDAIGTEKKVLHPLVQRLLPGGRKTTAPVPHPSA